MIVFLIGRRQPAFEPADPVQHEINAAKDRAPRDLDIMLSQVA